MTCVSQSRSGMLWRRFVHAPWRRQAKLVFLAAFLVRLGYVCISGQFGIMPPDYNEQVRIARYLNHGTGFVSPVGPERNDPSSWYVPGYIGLVAASFRLFGEDTSASFAAIQILNLLAQACAAALWVSIGRFLLGRRAAAVAAVLILVSPAITFWAGKSWDTYPTMLGGALCVAAVVFWRPRRALGQLLFGALCGAVAMVNPCFGACYPVWFIWNLRRQRDTTGPRARAWVQAMSALVGFAIVIAPWTVRNYVVFGEWFYLRGNMGLELWVGNAPWCDGYFLTGGGPCVHPVFDREEGERLVRRGEFAYFSDRMKEAVTWFREDTARVAGRVLERFAWFWGGHYPTGVRSSRDFVKLAGFTLPGLLALAGMIYMRLRRPSCWLFPATLVVFGIPYYLSLAMPRYRVPVEPLVLLMVAFLIVELVGHMRRPTTCGRRGRATRRMLPSRQ